MRNTLRHLPKKALSCILVLAVILCSITVMFSAFATVEPEAKVYTVSYRSPAIPMFSGKVLYLADLEVDFSAANNDTINGADVIWSTVSGDSVKLMGNYIYAQKTGMTKLTASYGGKTQNIYVIVNEQGDYNFNLVNVDFDNEAEQDLSNWMFAVNATYYNIYYDGTARGQMSQANYRRYPNQKRYGIAYSLTDDQGQKALNFNGDYYGSMLLYNAPIMKDFLDYTVVTNVRVKTLAQDGTPDFGVITNAQVNFDAPYAKADETGTPDADGNYPMDTSIPTIFAGAGAGGADGTALGLRLRPFGGLHIAAHGKKSVDGSTSHSSYAYHSLEDYTKLVGRPDGDPAGITADPNYVLCSTMVCDADTGAKNSDRARKIEFVLSGSDIKYSLDNNVILDTTGKIYRTTHTLHTELTTPKYSQIDYTGSYHEAFETNCATAGGNAIGFFGFSHDVMIYDFQVKLNGVTESTMPNLQDPSFYIVKSASPAIPMFAGKQIVTSDLAVEMDGELVEGSKITWTVASGTNVSVLGDYIYAFETGKTKLVATYGDKTQNVWVIVNNQGDYNFYLENQDWQKDYTSFNGDDWFYVAGNRTDKLNFYRSELPKNAGVTWGFYYPRSASHAYFEFYRSDATGMIFFKSEILKDFSDYTFTSTLLNTTDYSVGTARGFILRGDINFDAPLDGATSVFNTSGLYLGHHRYGAPFIGSYGKPYLYGTPGADDYHNMPTYTFHSLTGDDYYKFVNTKETMADDNGKAVAAEEWAGDPNYVMSMHNQGYANAKVVTIKLEGTDILYKIGENTLLDTKVEKVYMLSKYNQYSTATNVEYDWDANADKIVTNSGTIGFHAKQGMSHIYGFTVALNDVSADTMPKMSDPTFYMVKDASPAIPMYVGKFAYLNDIVIEFEDGLVSAKDANLTVKSGTAMIVGGGIYVAEAGTTVLKATYNGKTKNIYVIANQEGDNDFYLVNEILNAASFVDNEWIFANEGFSVPAAGYAVIDPSWTKGDAEDKVENGGNGLDASGIIKESGKISVGYKEHGMLIYKSEILKDFADYTAEFSYAANGSGWEHQTTFILRADLDYNVSPGDRIFPNYKTGGKYNAFALQFKKYGAPSLRNMTDSFNTVQQQWEKIGYHTVDDFAKLQYSTHGNYDPLYVLGAGVGKRGTVTVKLSGLDVIAKINGNTILDTTQETIKTMTFTKNATWADDIIVEGDSISSEDFKDTIATKTNTGSGTVGLQVSRSGSYEFSFTSLTVKLNNTEDNMPKMSVPSLYTVYEERPVIPMTAGTKLDLTSFVMEFNGAFVVPSSLAWSFEAADTNIKADADYIYAYERGAYTATVTNGTVTDYIHFVVKNPDETEYVIYENDYREYDDDTSDWKTVVMVGNNSSEHTSFYNSDDGKYITGNFAQSIAFPTFKPFAFVPYNYQELAVSVNKTDHLITYTTLDNDILADLSDYKVIAGMKMFPNQRGAVGIVGRVSDTTNGLYTPGVSTAVGFASSPGTYTYSQRYPQKTSFTIKNTATYTKIANSDVNYYLCSSVENRAFQYRIFEIDFSGNTATYTTPSGATEVITGLESTKGTVALFSESRDPAGTYAYHSVPALADIKIVLNNVDLTGLKCESIDHKPAATPEIEHFIDRQNYTFGTGGRNYIFTYTKDDDGEYSRKLQIPYEIDGRKYDQMAAFMNASPYNTTFGEIVFPEGHSHGYENLFNGVKTLEFVTIPKSCTAVGNRAYEGTNIINVVFPEGSKLTEIGRQGFYNNRSLHTVQLPEGLKTIGNTAFKNCTALYDINIPSTVQTIGTNAFEAVPIKEVKLPLATTSVGGSAFLNCNYLEKVYVLNPECTIGAAAIPATATIYGYTGSTAEEYATANGNKFIAVDDITSNPIPANSAFNLTSIKVNIGDAKVAGSDIAWDAHRDANYEVVNGWLMVYAEKDITVTGTYNSQTVSLNITVSAKGSDTALEVVTFADKNMTVTPVNGEPIKYTVVINENDSVALKHGTLKVTADGNVVKVLTATTDLEGTTYEYEAFKPETMMLTAEYTTMAERENSIYPLGVQVRPASDTYSAGLRFVSRFPEIKKEAAGIFLADEYKQVGVIIIPEILWTNSKLPDAEALTDESVSMGDYDAQNVIISKLMSANEAFSDAAALLTGIPTNMYDVQIMAIPYLIDKNDNVTYADIDTLTRSYNVVYNAAYPAYSDNIDNILYGGTDHDIDADPTTTAISYDVDEDISFIIKPKGSYQVKWALYKDDADVNAISELGEHEGSVANHVKSGTFTPGVDGDTLIVTTQMKEAGVVRLVFNLYDANGKAARTNASGGENNFSMSAAADYAKITQSVEELITAEELMAETKGYYSAWKTEWDAQVKVITDAIAADAGLAEWLADNSKAADSSYRIDETFKLTTAVNNGTYTSYFFWIATSDEGIFATDATPANKRPATGVFSVPNSADNSLDMYASFTAWGGNSVAVTGPQSGKLEVRVAGHGKDLGTTFDLNSGINTDDPTEVFNYGVLNRDYVALQVAKSIFDNKLKDDFGIKTNGGSMGGWRAVTNAAIDEDINEISTNITWMCQVGAAEAGDITSWHPVYCAGLRPFSTVTAARIINERVARTGEDFTIVITAGLGDYQASAPHGIIAMYNAFTDANVAKSLTFDQFREHGNVVYGSFTHFVSAVTNR